MKISANSIRAGNILVINGELWTVLKQPEHTKPGKGGAYVQVEMKNMKTGNKVHERFSSTDNVEKAFLEQRNFQYLYPEGDNLVFMDNESFEQITLHKDILADRLNFLVETMNVKLEFFGDKPLGIELPATVKLEIHETDPIIKASTVTSSYKPAICDRGIKVMVPQYVETGQKIIVKTEDSTFVERAK